MSIAAVAAASLLLLRRTRELEALRRAHEEIRVSEERYRLASYGTNDAIWDLNLVTGDVWVSEAYRERYGNPPGLKITWSSFAARVHPDDAPRVTAGFRDCLKSKTAAVWYDEFRYWQYDGTYAHVVDRGFLIRDAHGRAVRMIGALTNVTPLKRAEEAIDRLRRQNELILDSAGEGIVGIDLQGVTIFINPAAAEMLGWCREELTAVPLYDRIHPVDADTPRTGTAGVRCGVHSAEEPPRPATARSSRGATARDSRSTTSVTPFSMNAAP